MMNCVLPQGILPHWGHPRPVPPVLIPVLCRQSSSPPCAARDHPRSQHFFPVPWRATAKVHPDGSGIGGLDGKEIAEAVFELLDADLNQQLSFSEFEVVFDLTNVVTHVQHSNILSSQVKLARVERDIKAMNLDLTRGGASHEEGRRNALSVKNDLLEEIDHERSLLTKHKAVPFLCHSWSDVVIVTEPDLDFFGIGIIFMHMWIISFMWSRPESPVSSKMTW